MQRIIFAGSLLEGTPCQLAQCHECFPVGWTEWNSSISKKDFECWKMEISYLPLRSELQKINSKQLLYFIADPWKYFQAMLIRWYRQGGGDNPFIFYREFRSLVDEYVLESDISIRLFAEKLSELNLVPLYNPQMEVIDLSKRPKKIKNILEKDFNRVTLVSDWSIDATDTPFEKIELSRYKKYFLAFIENELILYDTFSKPENTTKNKKKDSLKNIPKIQALITTINDRRIKGRILLNKQPRKSFRIVIREKDKVKKRVLLPPSSFEKISAEKFRANFVLDTPSQRLKWREKDLTFLIMPGRHPIRLSKKAKEFLKSWNTSEN